MRPELESTVAKQTGTPEAETRSKSRALLEVAVLAGLIEIVMWLVPLTPDPHFAYTAVALVIAFFLFACQINDQASLRSLGLRFDNFFPVLLRISLPLMVFLVLLIIIGLQFESLRLGRKFLTMLVSVPPWALLQQYLLLAFVGRRFQLTLGKGFYSTLATALLFGLLHFPNPVLIVACAAGGFIWAREYQQRPNLFANAVTHTLASAMLANSLPGWLLKNMVVGYNYFLR
jgi:hypothetical protein